MKIKIDIPNEQFKMQIVGINGRHIQAFQQQTGSHVIIDDTPNAVFLQCDDEKKLETAKRVMEHLVRDGMVKVEKIKEYGNLYA